MIRFFVILFLAGTVQAQTTATISGRILNETTNQIARVDWVVLAKTGQGLETIQQFENVSDYTFSRVPLSTGAPYLVRAYYQGVLYTQTILVQEAKAYVVNLSVYNTTDRWQAMAVRIPHFIIVRNGNQLEVQQTFEVHNSSKTTYAITGEKNPTFRFQLPSGIQPGQVMTSYNRSLPVAAAAFEYDGAFGLNIPFRPGSTEIQLSYVAAYPSDGFTMTNHVFYTINECLVFVSPANIAVKSEQLAQQQDAQLAANDFAVYKASPLKANSTLSFTLSGGTQTRREAHDDHEQVVAKPSRIQNLIWVLLPALLGICMLVLYFALQRKTAVPESAKNTRIRKTVQKQDTTELARTKESLAKRIAELDDRFAQKNINSDEYQKKRSELKSELMNVARTIEKNESS